MNQGNPSSPRRPKNRISSDDEGSEGANSHELASSHPNNNSNKDKKQNTQDPTSEENYDDLEEEEEHIPEYDNEESISGELFMNSQKIEHIFLARESSTGTEYLVTFQNSQTPFAQWVPYQILSEVSNFSRLIQKFQETEMKFSFYMTFSNSFEISYDSPLHILSHRLLNRESKDGGFEFLFRFTLETGTAFFWEPATSESPQKLIDHYLSHRIRVINTNPEIPLSAAIDLNEAENFKSVDGQIPREYQIEGANWLLKSFTDRHGAILADEMGLGKTIQALMFLMHLNRNTDFHGPFLIIVRTNTFDQWCSEIERWSDLKYVPYTGTPEARHIIEDYQMPYIDDEGLPHHDCVSFNILLVTYDIFLKDIEVMQKIDWQVMIVDEGHRIKNADGKKHNALSSVKSIHKIILTGTPIQNTLNELWTLLNFVSPSYFSNSSIFPKDDIESLDIEVLNELKTLILPHLLHRSLADVNKSFKEQIREKIAFLQLAVPQKEMTRLTKMHELWRVRNGGEIDIQGEYNMLQRICNHPFLIDGIEQYYYKKLNKNRLELLIDCSSKFVFLDRILPFFKRNGSSVLIFSQRVKVLKLLAEYCKLKNYSHELLIGQLSEAERKTAIDNFCDDDKDVFIFLISTRSGAECLNLSRANIIIVFDPEWNPQSDDQGQNRSHNISPNQKIDIIRLITYGTYEHEIFARAQRKLKLWSSLLRNDPSLEEKVQQTPVNSNKPNFDSMINPLVRADTSELDGYVSQTDSYEENQDGDQYLIQEPPRIEDNLNIERITDDSYDEVLNKTATILSDIPLASCDPRYIPTLDLSLDMDNETFLNMFPVDENSPSYIKRKNKPTITRVPLDPKTAKRIIRQIELHGYGNWELIYKEIGNFCPLEELTKFCQAAVILHFRACEPARVACFPLLLKQLFNDIPGFGLNYAMCKDQSEWYSIFGKKHILFFAESSVCKQLTGHIHKTCVSFLSKLEHQLLLREWKSGDESYNFPYDLLPPHHLRDRKQDTELYNALMDGRDVSKELARVAQIFVVIKSVLVRRADTIQRTTFKFWTKYEVNTVLNLFRNFGQSITNIKPIDLHSKTALLSKETDDVVSFMFKLSQELFHRTPDLYFPLVISEASLLSSYAPPDCRESIVIEVKDVNDIVKRILINGYVRRALMNLRLQDNDPSSILPNGKDWFTYKHCKILLEKLIKYGCDYLGSILISPELPYRDNLTDDDVLWLSNTQRYALKEESNIPDFLLSDNKFYVFLKEMTGNISESQINEMDMPKSEIIEQPPTPKPQPVAVIQHVSKAATVRRVIPKPKVVTSSNNMGQNDMPPFKERNVKPEPTTFQPPPPPKPVQPPPVQTRTIRVEPPPPVKTKVIKAQPAVIVKTAPPPMPVQAPIPMPQAMQPPAPAALTKKLFPSLQSSIPSNMANFDTMPPFEPMKIAAPPAFIINQQPKPTPQIVKQVKNEAIPIPAPPPVMKQFKPEPPEPTPLPPPPKALIQPMIISHPPPPMQQQQKQPMILPHPPLQQQQTQQMIISHPPPPAQPMPQTQIQPKPQPIPQPQMQPQPIPQTQKQQIFPFTQPVRMAQPAVLPSIDSIAGMRNDQQMKKFDFPSLDQQQTVKFKEPAPVAIKKDIEPEQMLVNKRIPLPPAKQYKLQHMQDPQPVPNIIPQPQNVLPKPNISQAIPNIMPRATTPQQASAALQRPTTPQQPSQSSQQQPNQQQPVPFQYNNFPYQFQFPQHSPNGQFNGFQPWMQQANQFSQQSQFQQFMNQRQLNFQPPHSPEQYYVTQNQYMSQYQQFQQQQDFQNPQMRMQPMPQIQIEEKDEKTQQTTTTEVKKEKKKKQQQTQQQQQQPPPPPPEKLKFVYPEVTEVLFHFGNPPEMKRRLEHKLKNRRTKVPREQRPRVNYTE